MVIRAKFYFHLRRMGLPRLESDLIGQFKKGTILEEFVRKIMAFFVLVHATIGYCCLIIFRLLFIISEN